jgi:membrane fusion protein, heavy metal efflux system
MPSFIATICLLFLWILPVSAGPGHDHDHGPQPMGSPGPEAAPRLESTGTDFELVATAEGHTLTIYLDDMASNAPVENATIEISGEGIATAEATPTAPGTYILEADWADQPGTKALIFSVITNDAADLLNGILTIPEPAAPANAPSTTILEALRLPVVWLLSLLSALIGAALALLARPRRAPPAADTAAASNTRQPISRAAAIGVMATAALVSTLGQDASAHEDHSHDVPAAASTGNAPRRMADGTVFVPKPAQRLYDVRTAFASQSDVPLTTEWLGTVIPDPTAFGVVQAPMDGQIEPGDHGLPFIGGSVAAGSVLARLTPNIPLADLGTLQQLRADVDGKLRIAEQRLTRLQRIASVIAQRDIEDTQAELDALREQQRVLAPKGVEKIELKSPLSGTISVANVRTGQVVTARDTLYEIVDPDRLWVEAIGSDTHSAHDIAAAYAVDAAGHSIPLEFVAQAPALRQQALPRMFRVKQPHSGLAIGAPVKVLVQEKKTRRGVVLPEDSIVRGAGGTAQVWVKVSPEQFRAVTVRTAPIDGTRVLVTAELTSDMRVVVQGAELINQIR